MVQGKRKKTRYGDGKRVRGRETCGGEEKREKIERHVVVKGRGG
jgi:hypothetical protein